MVYRKWVGVCSSRDNTSFAFEISLKRAHGETGELDLGGFHMPHHMADRLDVKILEALGGHSCWHREGKSLGLGYIYEI